jgi:Spy/CpxP family protein refolding chaperone
MGGGRGKRHHGERGEDHGAKLAGRLCETVACSEEQSAQIAALVQDLPEPGQVPEADREALARAFRGESLSDDAVTAYLDAAAKARAADRAVLESKVVELHGLLTPTQRAALAERVAEDGPRALGMPGKGRGHGKKHDRGGKKGRRGSGPQGEAQQFG